MAGISITLEKNGVITKEPLEVWVSVLLPWNEYQDKERFKERLLKLSRSYKFRERTVKLNLIAGKSIVVLPEGAGTAAGFMTQKMSLFRGKKVGIGMFGYQNLTGLVFEDGKLKTGSSPKYGMSLFLDWVIERSSGLDRQKVLKAVNKAIKEIEIDDYARAENVINNAGIMCAYSTFPEWENLKAPQKLSTAIDKVLKEQEIKDICQILKMVSRDYRARVRRWLNEQFPTEEFDYLFISGGAAKFLRREIEEHCNCVRHVEREPIPGTQKYSLLNIPKMREYIPIGDSDEYINLVSDRSLLDKVVAQYGISNSEIEKMALDIRFVDNYGSMERLLKKEESYQGQIRSERASKAGKAPKKSKGNKTGESQKAKTAKTDSAVRDDTPIANNLDADCGQANGLVNTSTNELTAVEDNRAVRAENEQRESA